jgi:hypothetical protein
VSTSRATRSSSPSDHPARVDRRVPGSQSGFPPIGRAPAQVRDADAQRWRQRPRLHPPATRTARSSRSRRSAASMCSSTSIARPTRRVHEAGVRTQRDPRRHGRARDQPGQAHQAGEVRREVRARVPTPRRPLRRRRVRRLEGGEHLQAQGLGIERSAFLIDPDGTVADAWDKVSPPTRPNLLAALSA